MRELVVLATLFLTATASAGPAPPGRASGFTPAATAAVAQSRDGGSARRSGGAAAKGFGLNRIELGSTLKTQGDRYQAFSLETSRGTLTMYRTPQARVTVEIGKQTLTNNQVIKLYDRAGAQMRSARANGDGNRANTLGQVRMRLQEHMLSTAYQDRFRKQDPYR